MISMHFLDPVSFYLFQFGVAGLSSSVHLSLLNGKVRRSIMHRRFPSGTGESNPNQLRSVEKNVHFVSNNGIINNSSVSANLGFPVRPLPTIPT